ncbi:MAG: ribosome maturation factor RimM [Burkholderiaceae bacterium]
MIAQAGASSGVASPGETTFPADAIEVARIGDAWGVKGWFKVVPFATDPQAIFSSRRWFLKPPLPTGVGAPLVRTAAWSEMLRITGVKEHGSSVVAQAQDVASRGDALALRGARVFIARASFPTQSADEFYWVDLIGLQVMNRKGEALGCVVGLIETGPQSVLRVVAEATGAEPAPVERLIPFVSAYVDDVSLEHKRIRVDWELDY